MKSGWFAVVNPRAGGGKCGVDWPVIEGLLRVYSVEFSHAFTNHKHHAVELTVQAINNGYRKIIAVGGDGTLNEVVNGIFIQKKQKPLGITVGVIAVGTGNDWLRMYDIPFGYEGCVKAIKAECVFRQDVGRVEYWESKVQHGRYFVNAAGIGFDAEVVQRTNRLKELGRRGAMLYILSLLRTLLGYRYTKVNVSVDGANVREAAFSLTLGIGRFNGAGMMQVPAAVSNDGLYDITLIRRISKLGVIKSIHKLYNGSILNHPKISSYRGAVVEIKSDPPIRLEADGESLGESPFRFTILPEAISVVVSEVFISRLGSTTAHTCAADVV